MCLSFQAAYAPGTIKLSTTLLQKNLSSPQELSIVKKKKKKKMLSTHPVSNIRESKEYKFHQITYFSKYLPFLLLV